MSASLVRDDRGRTLLDFPDAPEVGALHVAVALYRPLTAERPALPSDAPAYGRDAAGGTDARVRH